MARKEMIKSISLKTGLPQPQIKQIVETTFDAIIQTLMTEGRVELRNFGIFQVRARAARNARNPKTGEKVQVPERVAVIFKAGKEMEERVAQMDSAKLANWQLDSEEDRSKKNIEEVEDPVKDDG
ncbi:MAG: HU family DNA-binding protein [Pirellulaceae bacterium]|jgi:nucleoid DNA-binding protein